MKKLIRRLIAIIMVFIMVAALLPITASAQFCAIILVDMRQKYPTVESLVEALPEMDPEAISGCHHLGGGTLFEIYYDVRSEEDGIAVVDDLRINPFVREVYYCSIGKEVFDPSSAAFDIKLVSDFIPTREDKWDDFTAELGKLFPEIEITRGMKYGRFSYRIECDAETWEAVEVIHSILKNSPFVSQVEFCQANCYDGHYRPIGSFTVSLKGSHTPEEVKALLPEIEIVEACERYGGFQYELFVNAASITETVEIINRVSDNPNIVYLYWIDGDGDEPCIAPNELQENYFKSPDRAEITVATALSALRIAADLAEAKNGVYDYKLADAIWEYDLDGDKEITVSDALRLLRKAAKLA